MVNLSQFTTENIKGKGREGNNMREKMRLIIPALALMVTLVLCCMQPVGVAEKDNSLYPNTVIASESVREDADDLAVSSGVSASIYDNVAVATNTVLVK